MIVQLLRKGVAIQASAPASLCVIDVGFVDPCAAEGFELSAPIIISPLAIGPAAVRIFRSGISLKRCLLVDG